MKIRITATLAIDDRAIEEHFVRSSGPGGQNVDKVATAVQLRFDPSGLPAEVRRRLRELVRSADDGCVLIEASRFRTQARNRADARARLIEALRQAAVRPRPRRPTKPSAAAKRRRVEGKLQRGEIKRRRGPVRGEE